MSKPVQHDQMSGHYGFIFVDSSNSPVVGPFHAVVVNSDATLDQLADQDGNEQISTYNLSSKTVNQGIVLTPLTDHVEFKSVGVSSGSIIAYYSENA